MKPIAIGKAEHQTIELSAEQLLETRLLIQGASGSGKSWIIRGVAEKLAKHIPTLILDLEGEFVTLREQVDLVLAGENGDTGVDVRSAGLLARKLLELQLSAVVDLSDLTRPQRKAYVRGFLESIMAAPRKLWGPRLVVVDEAHEFAPESSKSESLSAVIDLASRGRKRGFCLVAATQRLSKLHKDVAAELRNVMIGHTTLDVDVKRSLDTLGMPADLEHKREIRGLEHQFYAMGPAFTHVGVELVTPVKPQTTHPQSGARRSLEPPQPSKAIRKVLGELADLPEKAEEEAKTLAEAKAKIRQLERELKAKPTGEVIEKIVADEKQTARAVSARDKHWQGEIAKLERSRSSLLSRIEKIRKVAELNGDGAVAITPPSEAKPQRTVSQVSKPVTVDSLVVSEGLSGVQQRIIDAIAWWNSVGVSCPKNNQVGAVALIDASGGYFSNVVGPLSSSGYITRERGSMRLTDAGLEVANIIAEPPSLEEYHDVIRERVRNCKSASGATLRVLDAILAAGGEEMTCQEIGEATDIDHTGGYFSNSIGPLSTLGFIKRSRGVVQPTDLLFPASIQ